MASNSGISMTSQFELYRNLLFYYGHQPTYFYFNSLTNYESKRPEYNSMAEAVASKGRSILNSGFLDIDKANVKDSEAILRLTKALETLEKAVQYERDNEMAYFKQKYALLKSNFTPEEIASSTDLQALEQLFSDIDNFDYNKFIAIANTLIQGFSTTKAIARYEEDRLKDVRDAMQKIRKTNHNRLVGLAHKNELSGKKRSDFLIRGLERRERKIEMTYLESGNLNKTKTYYRGTKDNRKTVTTSYISGVQKYLEPVKSTVDVALGKWITDEVKNIVNNKQIMQIISEQIEEWYIKNMSSESADIAKLEANMKGHIIQCFCEYGSKHIPEILSGAYERLSLDDITKMLDQSFNAAFNYEIDGLYDNFGQFGLSLEVFKDVSTIQELKDAPADQLYESLTRLYDTLSRYKQKQPGAEITNAQRLTMKAIGGGLGSKDDEYKNMMKLIKLLEDIQKKYEKAVALDEKINTVYRTAAGTRSVKSKSGERMQLTVTITDGKLDLSNSFTDANGNKTPGLRQQIKGIEGADKFIRYASDIDANSLKGLIQGLKGRVSRQLHKDIIKAAEAWVGKGKSEGAVIGALRDGLQGMRISISGPSISELRQSILQNFDKDMIVNYQTGKINRKNDVVTITVKVNEKEVSAALSKTIDETAPNIAEVISSSQNEMSNQFASDFSKYFYKELSKLNDKSGPEHNSYAKNAEIFFEYAKKQEEAMSNANETFTKVTDMWHDYEAAQLAAGADAEQLAKERTALLNSLQDTFFISSTMKTYNQYQNNLGFIGGSLGANIQEQVDNMCELFDKAGVPMQPGDRDWLISAIINCSPNSIVGERNKNVIENYLGAMAAFALFDEGSAELQIIKELDNPDSLIINSSPNILHLYVVNGMYIPGSYVLEQTCKQLQQCVNLCNMAIGLQNNGGASVKIYNPMTETGIPNRGKKLNLNHLNRDPWGVIGARAASSVKIKVMFLGGLLDILNKLNSALDGIQLPTT